MSLNKEALVPADNETEALNAPDYVKQNLKITLVESIEQVLEIALLK